MLDTVRMNAPCNMRRPVPRSEWLAAKVKPWTSQDGAVLLTVEAALPKLIWGHNGRPIANQEELDAAFEKLRSEASRFADIPPLHFWQPQRLDLAWQFDVSNAAVIIDIMSGLRYPDIRTPAIHQAGRCVTWRGAGSRFMVQAYNKPVKMHQKGQVLRLEVRLRGAELRRLGGRDWCNFAQLYDTFREIVIRLPEIELPDGKCGWPEAIGRVVPAEFHECLLAHLGQAERTKRKTRFRIRAARPGLKSGFSLNGLLPAGNPPTPVSVEPRTKIQRTEV